MKGFKVFNPQNWEGIKGIPDLEIEFYDLLLKFVKPKPRSINPKLYVSAKTEFDRLMKYFYRYSTSSVASCLLIAPKNTKPFIRFCGDYVFMNQFIKRHVEYIPKVPEELTKIKGFSIYIDLDLTIVFINLSCLQNPQRCYHYKHLGVK